MPRSAMMSRPRTDTSAARPPNRRIMDPITTAAADATNADFASEPPSAPASARSARSSRSSSFQLTTAP
eukprot:scaffold118518_cov60-Phaeocystis_antarctica.AAC.1